MGLQLVWSFGLASFDAYALATKKILHNPILVSLFAVGDWVSLLLVLFLFSGEINSYFSLVN